MHQVGKAAGFRKSEFAFSADGDGYETNDPIRIRLYVCICALD